MNSKIRIIAVLIAAVCLAFSSCSGKKDPSAEKDGQQNDQQTQQAPDSQNQEGAESQDKTDIKVSFDKDAAKKAIEILKEVPEYPEGYPTLEDAALVYQKANMAVGWIIHTERVAVYEDDTLIVDGVEYKRVRPDCFYGADNLEKYADKFEDSQKLIFNMDCLEAYLCTLINPEDAKEYIIDAKETNKFVEDENGNLYVLPFNYTPDGFGKETYTLDDNGDGTYTFNVAYTLVDADGNVYKERTRKFKFAQIDGRWVFDRFIVIRQ